MIPPGWNVTTAYNYTLGRPYLHLFHDWVEHAILNEPERVAARIRIHGAYESIHVPWTREKGWDKPESLLALNPRGQVPVLVDDERPALGDLEPGLAGQRRLRAHADGQHHEVGRHRPRVTEVDHHAIGQGLQVALMADWRVGSERSRYQMPELAIGMPCPLGSCVSG